MDPQIVKALHEKSIKFTPELAEGLATSQLKLLEDDIDKYLRFAFNEDDAVRYVGYRRCTPLEEFRVGSRQYGKNMYDLADSHVYMCAYNFEVNGVPMKNPRYMYLIYTDRGGVLSLRGVKYHISPVSVDGGISVESHTIFAWIEKDKLRLERLTHSFVANGTLVPNYVMYSQLYRLNAAAKSRCLPATKRNKSESTAMHYLLCKYGLKGVFKRFLNVDVVAGNLLEEDYPRDRYVFCEPSPRPPSKFGKVKEYTPTRLRLAVPTEQWNEDVCLLVTAFFYIADHFPNMVNESMLETPQSWRVVLGHTIFKSGESTAVLLDYVESHFRSIESLLDPMVIKKLEFCDVYVKDFYEFLFHFSSTMAKRLLEADPANVSNKKLTVNSYVGYPYMEAITTMVRMVRRISRESITESNVTDAMNQSLRTEEILKLGTGNTFTSVLSNPGDCLLFKTTNLVVDQEHANASSKPKLSPSNLKPAHRLHMSVVELYAFGNLPKSMPNHRRVINHAAKLNPDGSYQRDPRIREFIATTQKSLERR